MDGDSSADRFPNNDTNGLGNMGTSTASTSAADPGNQQSMGRKLVKKFNQVRDRQGRDSDGRFLVAKSLDPAVAKLAVLKGGPSDSSTPRVDRQGST